MSGGAAYYYMEEEKKMRKKPQRKAKITRPKGSDRWIAAQALGGDWGIRRKRDVFFKRFSMTEKDAKEKARKLNTGRYKLSFFSSKLKKVS